MGLWIGNKIPRQLAIGSTEAKAVYKGAVKQWERKEEEFLSRVSPATADVVLGTIKGKSLVWNQMIRNGNFADGTNDWGITYSDNINIADGVLSLENTSTSEAVSLTPQNTTRSISGHKYLFRFKYNFDASIGSNIVVASTGVSFSGPVTCDGAFHEFKQIYSGSNNQPFTFFFRPTQITGAVLKFANFCLIDLTLMFGAGYEPSTVAEFEAMFPADYYNYDAGSLLNLTAESIISAGQTLNLGLTDLPVISPNIWDEEWELGGYTAATGQEYPWPTRIRSKNFICEL